MEKIISLKLLDFKKASGWALVVAKYGSFTRSLLPSSEKNRILVLADYERLYEMIIAGS